SSMFLAHPVRPSSSALALVHQRNPTPCTRPRTHAVSRTSLISVIPLTITPPSPPAAPRGWPALRLAGVTDITPPSAPGPPGGWWAGWLTSGRHRPRPESVPGRRLAERPDRRRLRVLDPGQPENRRRQPGDGDEAHVGAPVMGRRGRAEQHAAAAERHLGEALLN